MKLHQKDILLALRQSLGLFDGGGTLIHRHSAVILPDLSDKVKGLKVLAKQSDLLAKLAEDDPPVLFIGKRILFDEIDDLIELPTGSDELRTEVAEVLTLPSIDVDLRIHADLAQTKENGQTLQGGSPASLLICTAPLVLQIVEDSRIDLLLVLVCKLEIELVDLRRRRESQTGGRLALEHLTGQIATPNPGLIVRRPAARSINRAADKLQIADSVVERVDDRSCSQTPLVLRCKTMNGKSGDRLAVANTLSLVENDTIPVKLLKLGNIRDEPIVMTEKDGRAILLLADGRPTVLVGHDQIQITPLRSLLPLLPDSERHQNQSSLDLVVDKETESLNRLAEAHFVAEDAATNNVLIAHLEADLLLGQHPTNPYVLMFCIVDRGPDLDKRFLYNHFVLRRGYVLRLELLLLNFSRNLQFLRCKLAPEFAFYREQH